MNTDCSRMVSFAPGTKLDWNKKDCDQLVNYYSNPSERWWHWAEIGVI